jgi:hypothetical protein
VIESRNEFAEWVEVVFSEISLADNLRRCHDRLQAADVMEKHLKAIKFEPEQSTLTVNWFWVNRTFDFDEVRIIDTDDFNLETFVVQVRNDNDKRRLARYGDIPVIISVKNPIMQSKINLLRDTFGNVISQ